MKNKIQPVSFSTFGVLTTLLLSSGCFFDLERDAGLNPGDVVGTALLQDGSPAAYARVVVDGTGTVRRADDRGRFIVKALSPGAWSLRLDYDRDGDGWPEAIALRTVRIALDDNGDASSYLLGDVVLDEPASVVGVVEVPAGISRSGINVSLFRSLQLELDGVAFDADQGLEARVATGPDGAFFFPAVLDGDAVLRVRHRDVDGTLYAANDVLFAINPGANTLDDNIVLRLVEEGPAGPNDVFPAGDLISVERRTANLLATPREDTTEKVVVDLVIAGNLPLPPNFEGPRVFSGDDVISLDNVPFGVLDVYVRTDLGRSGVLLQRQVGPGSELIEWGLIQLGDLDCPNADCDGDGVRGLPPQQDAPSLWEQCASQCSPSTDFDIVAVADARCVVGGVTYDCEDDGDGQPDTTEPACYGLYLGADHDGDRLCDPVDPYPFCAANDATCDPDDATGHYGDQTDFPELDGGVPDGGTPDAGDDAGVDAGADGGVDAGPTDGGVDAGPSLLPPAILDGLFGEESQLFPREIFVDDSGGFYLVGDANESGIIDGPTGCLDESAVPQYISNFIARTGADGTCHKIQFSGFPQYASGGTRVFRDGSGFVSVTIVGASSSSMSIGVDINGAEVTDPTVGDHLVIAHFGADLVLEFFSTIPLDLQSAYFAGVPKFIRLGNTLSVLVTSVGGGAITVAPNEARAYAFNSAFAFLRLDENLEFTAGVDGSGIAGDEVSIPSVAKLPTGFALSLTSNGDVFGEPVTGNDALVLYFGNDLVHQRTSRVEFNSQLLLTTRGTELRGVSKSKSDPSGVYAVRPAFGLNNTAVVYQATTPGVQAEYAGSIPNMPNLATAAFDATTRSVLTATATSITASTIPLDFTSTTTVVANVASVTKISVDSQTRDMFFTTNDAVLHRCNVDDCDATTVDISFVVNDFEIDVVTQKIFFQPSFGLSRMNYDGTGEEGFTLGFPSGFAIDHLARVAYAFDTGGSTLQRFDLDSGPFPQMTNVLSLLAPIQAIEVDTQSGRVFFLTNNNLESIDSDGNDRLLTDISGGNGATGGLFAVAINPLQVTHNGVQVALDFNVTNLLQFPAAGAPTVTTLLTPLDTASVNISAFEGKNDGLFIAGALSSGRAMLSSGKILRADNEIFAPVETFLMRVNDDGGANTIDWISESYSAQSTRVRSLAVTDDDHVFASMDVSFEGTLGSQSFSGRDRFVWRLPPGGDPNPPYSANRPDLGGVDITSILATNANAVVSSPHGNGGFVSIGEVAALGPYYLDRGDVVSTTWRHELAFQPLELSVSPDGATTAVLFAFTGDFDPAGLDLSGVDVFASDGLAALIFDIDGNVQASAFVELAGATADALDVNNNGQFAISFSATGGLTLEVEQGTGIDVTEEGGLLVRYGADGRVISQHSAGSVGSSHGVSIADDGSTVALFEGTGFALPGTLRVIHVTSLGVLDWEVVAEGVDGTILPNSVRISQPGGFVVVGLVSTAAFVSLNAQCGNDSFTTQTGDFVVAAIDGAGCIQTFAAVRTGNADPAVFQMDIIDAANNVVVAGPYSTAVSMVSSAVNGLPLSGSGTEGAFVAVFDLQSSTSRLRALYGVNDTLGLSVTTLGSSPDGRLWLHAATSASTVTFSDAPADPVSITSGFIWNLEIVNNTGFVFR